MLESFLDIGKNLKTWPQLGATESIAGGIITTVIKKIRLNEKIKSGRYNFSLDEMFVIPVLKDREQLIDILDSKYR